MVDKILKMGYSRLSAGCWSTFRHKHETQKFTRCRHQLGLVKFTSFISSPPPVPFTPDLHTGVLRTSGSIDLEEDDHFRFLLYVSDNGIPPFTATTTVRVQVLDVNDHYPLFNSIGGYTATLDEDDQQPRTSRRIAVVSLICCLTNYELGSLVGIQVSTIWLKFYVRKLVRHLEKNDSDNLCGLMDKVSASKSIDVRMQQGSGL